MHTVLLLVVAAALAIDLKQYQRLSHDTLLLGERKHPRNATRKVSGYAFLHLDHASELARAQRLKATPVSKHLHFDRRSRSQIVAAGDRVSSAVGFGDCSMPIADGAVWKSSHGYFINARNSLQLSAVFIERAIGRAFRRWSCVLHSPSIERLVIGPLLSVRTDRDGNQMNSDAPDGANEIGLATIGDRPGTIALTVLWGVFSGPPNDRELTEFDMFFDQTHYRFGNSSTRSGVVDFEATATHEAGHVMGLDDIYDFECADVTMFATSAIDETKKRTLESADVDGVTDLYD